MFYGRYTDRLYLAINSNCVLGEKCELWWWLCLLNTVFNYQSSAQHMDGCVWVYVCSCVVCIWPTGSLSSWIYGFRHYTWGQIYKQHLHPKSLHIRHFPHEPEFLKEKNVQTSHIHTHRFLEPAVNIKNKKRKNQINKELYILGLFLDNFTDFIIFFHYRVICKVSFFFKWGVFRGRSQVNSICHIDT